MSPRKPKGKKATGRSRATVTEATRRSLSRLERVLLLVPYCVKHPGVTIDELADRMGASRKEILDDLNLLFVCGLPDYTPADLIEVSIEEDQVFIRMADYFARPLRLTRTEAIPLYLKANALLDLLDADGLGLGGFEEIASLRSAMGKLGNALLPQEGGVAELTQRIKVHLEEGESRWLPLLREAVTHQHPVEMEYYSYSRDALTRRTVDPYLVFASLGHWYLSGHCHLVDDRRMFRLDRIRSLDVTDATFEAPDDGSADMPPPLLYVPGPEDVQVKLRVKGTLGAWLSEYLPVESSTERSDGTRELVFHTSHFPWLEKLLLRLGSDVEVVHPPELADRVQAASSRILELYEDPAKAMKRG